MYVRLIQAYDGLGPSGAARHVRRGVQTEAVRERIRGEFILMFRTGN